MPFSYYEKKSQLIIDGTFTDKYTMLETNTG